MRPLDLPVAPLSIRVTRLAALFVVFSAAVADHQAAAFQSSRMVMQFGLPGKFSICSRLRFGDRLETGARLRGRNFVFSLGLRGSQSWGEADAATLAILRREGFEAATSGQFHEAAVLLGKYLSSIDTPDIPAMNCRGAMLAELHEWRASEECLQAAILGAKALGDDSACVNAYFNLGNIFYKQNKLKHAAAAFRSVLELRKSDVQALNNLGLALSASGEKEAALESFTAAADLDPDDPVALTNQANVLADLRRHVDAVLCYEEAADRGAELDLDYWLNLGVAARRAGMTSVAEEALQSVVEIDPDHVLARRLLGTVQSGGGEVELSAEEEAAYAAGLFDGYAEDFERELVSELHYRVPGRLVALLLAADGREQPEWSRVVDVGCGSGLVSDFVREHCGELRGVDASAAMAEQAMQRVGEDGGRAYDDVSHGELTAYLDALPGGAEVVVAADVLCYISDLRPAFRAAAEALRRGEGRRMFAFSTEDSEPGSGSGSDMEGEGAVGEGQGWRLKASGRYGHSAAWVREALDAAGLEVERESSEALRRNGEEEIWGRLWVARAR